MHVTEYVCKVLKTESTTAFWTSCVLLKLRSQLRISHETKDGALILLTALLGVTPPLPQDDKSHNTGKEKHRLKG